ncbi:hypothetical protein ACFQO9_06590 [Chryseobacterium zhengzhouense]|uniref:Uncharacterized protein n=1 Tax=Chryseobacterium zhengzhouense TaxID=1636086 RepID=A0ABW2LUZ1_9FLAO
MRVVVIQNVTKWSEESPKSYIQILELRSHPFRLCQNDNIMKNQNFYS